MQFSAAALALLAGAYAQFDNSTGIVSATPVAPVEEGNSTDTGVAPAPGNATTTPVVPGEPNTTTTSGAAGKNGSTITTVVTAYTTYCPPGTYTENGETYTVTEATTLTITNCPCTLTAVPSTITTVITETAIWCPTSTEITYTGPGGSTGVTTVTEATTVTVPCPPETSVVTSVPGVIPTTAPAKTTPAEESPAKSGVPSANGAAAVGAGAAAVAGFAALLL